MVEIKGTGPSLEEAPFGTRPLALLLSGGAALSSWQGGILERLLHNEGIEYHTLIGTSGGALNVAAVFQGDIERLSEMWRRMDKRMFFKLKPKLVPPSVYCQDRLRSFLGTVFDEERCRRDAKGWLHIISADVNNFETVQSVYTREPGGRWDSPMLEYLLGSISVPMLLPPVRVPREGHRDRMLVDGHLTSFLRLREILGRGVRDILVVNVTEGPGADMSGLRPYISTMLGGLLIAQIDNALEAVEPEILQEGVRVFELRPQSPLAMSVFGFNPAECLRAFSQGSGDAESFLKEPGRFRRI